MMVSNRNLLFQGSIFRFHVCFGGCIIFEGGAEFFGEFCLPLDVCVSNEQKLFF